MELPLKYQFKISRKAISYLIVEVTKATVNGTMVTAATENGKIYLQNSCKEGAYPMGWEQVMGDIL